MATIRLSARGAADARTAWDRYADTRNWTSWAPHLFEVRTEDDPMLHAGMRGTVRSITGPRLPFEVTALDAARRTWSWTVRLGPVRFDFDHGVEPDGAGSRTWLHARGPLPLLVGYAPIAALSLRRLVQQNAVVRRGSP